jgi:hypothetical protein
MRARGDWREELLGPSTRRPTLEKAVGGGLEEWRAYFDTWVPFSTALNDFTFEDYHMFRSNVRMLVPGTEVH